MNSWAFRIYTGSFNNVSIGGSITAESMDDAVAKIIELNHVEVVAELCGLYLMHYYSRHGKQVQIVVWANPEVTAE